MENDVYRPCTVEYVGAAIRRPHNKILRICIGFRRIRNMVPPGGC